MENFFFRPAAREKERHAAKCHHPDGVCHKRYRHKPPQVAHFTNVLFAVTTVNHRARTEEQQRFEKTMREQVRDARCNSANAQRHHHQPKLRDG